MENKYKEEAFSTGQPVAQPLQSDDKPVQLSKPGIQKAPDSLHKQEDESPLGSITSKEQPEEQSEEDSTAGVSPSLNVPPEEKGRTENAE